MSANKEDRIRALSIEKDRYSFRAYMSSALTNLSTEAQPLLKESLTDLYLEVFDPLKVFLYLPHLWSSPGHDSLIPAEDVHILDRLRIAESDFLVLCADYPSFGAGQEFEIAQASGLPIIAYCQDATRVSRMLKGGAGYFMPAGTDPEKPSLSLIQYVSGDDLKLKLRRRVTELISILGLRADNEVEGAEFNETLRSAMVRKRIDSETLAERTGFSIAFVEFLLSSEVGVRKVLQNWQLPDLAGALNVLKYANPGLWVVHKVALALKVPIEELVGPKEAKRSEIVRSIWKVAIEEKVSAQLLQRELELINEYEEERWEAARGLEAEKIEERVRENFRKAR